MTEEFGKLEHILIHANKANTIIELVIGGLDKFVGNWSTRVKAQADAEHVRLIDTIVQTLAGYSNASAETRQEMILRALELLRGQTPVTNIDPVIAPVVIDEDLPEAPPNDFDEEPPKMQSRPATGLGLDASVTRLQNVGPAHGKKLNRLGVETIGDLMYHFPHRYDDFSKLKTISQLMYGEEVSLLVTVCEARTRAIRNKMNITTVLLADMTGTIQATYFNQPWLQQQFKAGRRIIVSGRIEQDLGHLAFKQPEWEPFSKELVHTGRIVPVYPLTEGLSNRWLRRLISDVVEYWADQVPEPLPDAIRAREKLPGLATALREIHFPSSFEKMESVRHRLALDEFLLIQLGVLRQRRLWREKPGRALRVDSRADRAISRHLALSIDRRATTRAERNSRRHSKNATDEPAIARRRWLRQNDCCGGGDADRRSEWRSSRTPCADRNSGGATLQNALETFRQANQAAARRTTHRQFEESREGRNPCADRLRRNRYCDWDARVNSRNRRIQFACACGHR